MHLLGALGDAVDDRGGTLLELAGDAVDALVQHLVDAVGEVDELVVDVAGLEVEAGGQPLAGIEHRAGGLGAGLLEAVEQVAAALAERQDHVVAGVAQRAGDVGAAFFQRAGDGFRDLVDARGDRVRDQRDVVAEVDLHAGNGAADLLGLADQIVALMRDVLEQGADADFVVGIGALKCCDLVGDQRLELAGARDGALDAVAHRRDLAADGLADGDHGIGRRTFGLGEADRDLRHRLRDLAHLLAAPDQAREEVEQHDRREEHRGEAGDRQHATALAHGGPDRGQEADRQRGAGRKPDDGEDGRTGVDVAGRAARLQRLEQLADGLAVVIGGAARGARFLDRIEYGALVGGSARLERRLVEHGRHRRRDRRRRFVAHRCVAAGIGSRVADVEGFLDRRKRNFCGIFDLFGSVGHVQSSPRYLYASPREPCALRKPTDRIMPLARISEPSPPGRLVRQFPKHPIGRASRMKWLRLRQS